MKKAPVRSDRTGLRRPLVTSVWWCLFVAYGGAFSFWGWLMPQGFPFVHPQFWANFGLPLIVVFVSVIGVLSLLRGRASTAKTAALFLTGFTGSAFISSLMLFPISLGPSNGLRFLFFLLVMGGWTVLLLLLTVWFCWPHQNQTVSKQSTRKKSGRPLLNAASAMLSVVAGIGLARVQQSLPAATLPLNETIPPAFNTLASPQQVLQAGNPFKEIPSQETASQETASQETAGQTSAKVWPEGAMILAQCGTLELQIYPLLTFRSKSPDRFWTVFAPPDDHVSPRRNLSGQTITDEQLLFGYVDEGKSWLSLQGSRQEDEQASLEIESYSNLPKPIYSHLNTYAQLMIEGGERLAISFAATGDVPVELREAGYPFGKPARMAYLDPSGQFAVVEASNAEKGPFRSLAEGPLEASEALVFTLYNNETPQCSVSLKDWAAQASKQLSPTAGWGFTENAIGFQLIPADKYDDALPTGFIHISLANTSTGRGFESVGHAAGLYRNRMQVTQIDAGLN